MTFLDDAATDALNRVWSQHEPERIHQSRGDKLKLRVDVREADGTVSKWTLRLGRGERTLARGSALLPDAVVEVDDATLEQVLTSDDPASLSGALAAGRIRVRGNTEKLYENLGDVLAISDGPTRAEMSSLLRERTGS